MKLLLTSAGISNASIRNALIDLLGKPIEESNALFIPTAIYPFEGGATMALKAIQGQRPFPPLAELGWKSLGILELTALSSIDKETWIREIQSTDALLVWGGDPVYLAYWLNESGLAELLPSLLQKVVYVGVSAGSMAASKILAETYTNVPKRSNRAIKEKEIVFKTMEDGIKWTVVTAHGAGLVDFAIIPHYNNIRHQSAMPGNAEQWAAELDVPVYAIDDQSAVKVVGNTIEVISEGGWKLLN